MKTKLLPLAAILSISCVATAHAACASHGAVHTEIQDNGKGAYVIDSNGDIVRDRWRRCVRTIHWSEDIQIAQCEGKTEDKPLVMKPKPVAKPAPVVEPAPVVAAPVPAPAPVIIPEPVVEAEPVAEPEPAPTLANFRGFFENNSAELKDSAHEELNKFADYMTNNPESRIIITGHTDSRGSEAYNQKLSERRANAVKDYLTNKGIESNRMTSMGAGESSPVADNSTSDGRAQNRRVAVELAQ